MPTNSRKPLDVSTRSPNFALFSLAASGYTPAMKLLTPTNIMTLAALLIGAVLLIFGERDIGIMLISGSTGAKAGHVAGVKKGVKEANGS